MSKSVLIVDDEPIIHEALIRIFTGSSLEINYVFTMDEALKAINPGVGVILTDVQLAGLNGFNLVEIVHKNYPEIYIFIMTGFATLEMAKHSLELGATAFFTKPFKDPEKIVKMITSAAANEH